MAVYIKLEDAVEAFKKAEADDIERYGCHIIDCFPAERAIDIINNLPLNANVDVNDRLSCFTALKCPPEYTYSCHHLMDGVDCEDCWYQWLNEEHYEPKNETRH